MRTYMYDGIIHWWHEKLTVNVFQNCRFSESLETRVSSYEMRVTSHETRILYWEMRLLSRKKWDETSNLLFSSTVEFDCSDYMETVLCGTCNTSITWTCNQSFLHLTTNNGLSSFICLPSSIVCAFYFEINHLSLTKYRISVATIWLDCKHMQFIVHRWVTDIHVPQRKTSIDWTCKWTSSDSIYKVICRHIHLGVHVN